MFKWKGYDNFFNSQIDKNTQHKSVNLQFSKPKSLGGNVKVELNL